MLAPDRLGLFVAAAVVLLIVPGPAVIYIVARSVEQGRIAGLVSVAGIGAGTLIHVVAAAFGLSAIVVSSPAALTAVKFAGAAYLLWLGARQLASAAKPEAAAPDSVRTRELRRIFWQGTVVNLLNPKALAFLFAFLPQFVEPERGSVAGQVVVLGLLFVGMGAVSDSAWALAAGLVAARLRARPGMLRAQRRVAGATLVLLGVAAALSAAR